MTDDRPKLLDLFCGAGGAAAGYVRAGFHVTGVDIKPQPRYLLSGASEFIHGDALEYCREHGHEFDVIHASPPCQAYSVMKPLPNVRHKEHPDLIPETRDVLRATRRPYVIENVPGAPLHASLVLCGSMFGLRSHRGYLRRHRLFESSLLLVPPCPCRHEGVAIGVYGHGSAGLLGQRMRAANAEEGRILMDMPWSTRDGLSQAIPPAYALHIGRQLMLALRSEAA